MPYKISTVFVSRFHKDAKRLSKLHDALLKFDANVFDGYTDRSRAEEGLARARKAFPDNENDLRIVEYTPISFGPF